MRESNKNQKKIIDLYSSGGKAQKKGKGKNDKDDKNGGGGLLEPIIEDIKGWIGRRRETSEPQPMQLYL